MASLALALMAQEGMDGGFGYEPEDFSYVTSGGDDAVRGFLDDLMGGYESSEIKDLDTDEDDFGADKDYVDEGDLDEGDLEEGDSEEGDYVKGGGYEDEVEYKAAGEKKEKIEGLTFNTPPPSPTHSIKGSRAESDGELDKEIYTSPYIDGEGSEEESAPIETITAGISEHLDLINF